MSCTPIDKLVLSYGGQRDLDKLKELLSKTSVKVLQATLRSKMGRSDCATFWNYLLLGFDPKDYELREKRYACVKFFLDNSLKVEISYKQMFDLMTRLCQDLPTFPEEQLVEIYEHCIESIRLGDPKCVGWKDLLPDTVKILYNLPELSVNGVRMKGPEFKDNIIKNLCTMRWPVEVLTPIANMCRELMLSNAEMDLILKKFCGMFDSLAPSELPALCFQIFSMCTTASQIVMPILALERYFHRYYYKKLFSDLNSNSTDFNSIDKFSDSELREAEETILHHLNYCTQYQITELQICAILRNFQAMPDVILTPFMLSAIIAMTPINKEPDTTRLSTSLLLPFLRSVIKNNEDERLLSNHSHWCRETLPRREVDLTQLFSVLIDQNKEGKDTITPGLVNLAFLLLKTKNNQTLNNLAIKFLIKFIRKRFMFGRGIIKKLAYWMILEQDQNQYSECLVQLSVADTFTVSECIATIKYVMDFFLHLPGERSMQMMSFIFPILKISAMVRDAFIEVLRKAMSSSDVRTRRMAIYGFCMILKQLNNNNSQRSQLASSFCTQQHSISGYSLMSQTTFGNRSNPQRHFDMLTLEIIGVLRNCFGQSVDIKITLYENLQRAVEMNSKLSPHVLQFVDWHFRSYFVAPPAIDNNSDENVETDIEFSIKFDKIVQAADLDQHEISITDNLGKLILFVAHCLVIFERFETEYDTREIKRLLKMSVDKTLAKELKFDEMFGSFTHYKRALSEQQINFIEGIMAYMILASKQTNENVKCLCQLFQVHQKMFEAMKKALSNTKKGPTKSKNESSTANNITINGIVVSKIDSNVENIWDLDVTEKFLRLLHEDIVPFASPANTNSLRSNVELVRYVLEVTTTKVEAISLAPEYKQLSHSKRTLKHLTDITKIIYERCIKRLPELWRDFDMKTAILAAECFQKCLQTANQVYKKNFTSIFVKGFDIQAHQQPRELPISVQNVIDEYMNEFDEELNDSSKVTEHERLPAALLLALEVLYENISYCDSITTESYTWLKNFCTSYEIKTRKLSVVLKLLFTQRQKTHSGAFFDHIATHFKKIFGRISDEDDVEEEINTQNPDLKALNFQSFPFCFQYFYDALRKQIDDVEYFIVKANNVLYKLRIIPEADHEFALSSLRGLQRSICTQLSLISKTLFELANVQMPLGISMDGQLKLLTQFYVCLKNLTKHFHAGAPKITLQNSKFDLLLKDVGRKLPKRIYDMISYIDNNTLTRGGTQKSQGLLKKRTNPKEEKEKVLREAKPISKVVLSIESFNSHVILLAKKSNDDRFSRFLHMGTSRDFRLQNHALAAALKATLSHSSQISSTTSTSSVQDENEDTRESTITMLDDPEEIDVENESRESEENSVGENEENKTDDNSGAVSMSSTRNTKTTTTLARSKSSKCLERLLNDDGGETSAESNTPTPEDMLLDDEPNSRSQLIRNLKKVNKKAQKRALEESEHNAVDPDVAAAVDPPKTKKRRGRSAMK